MFKKGHGVVVDGQRAMIVRRFRAPHGNPQRYLVEWSEDREADRDHSARLVGEVVAVDADQLLSQDSRKAR